jgi:hypothetical protein
MPPLQLTREQRRVVARNRIGGGPFVLVSLSEGTPYLISEGMTPALWMKAAERLAFCLERAYGINREAFTNPPGGGSDEDAVVHEGTPEGQRVEGDAKGKGKGRKVLPEDRAQQAILSPRVHNAVRKTS